MKIKELVAKKGIKQVQLVRELGASPSTINLYLNGWRKLPPKYLGKLAHILGVTISEVDRGEVEGSAHAN